jgi:two-component system alkaline phosphatase synthesis response regulator PhoP
MMTTEGQSTNILLVDHDNRNIHLLTKHLARGEFHVSSACDGSTALQLLESERPDLMILNLMLPDAVGWDVMYFVRHHATFKNLPVIMLTTRLGDSDKFVGQELGADDYITRPFNPREVVARVRVALRRAQTDEVVDSLPVLEWYGLQLDTARHLVKVDQQPVELTPTEFNLLRILMERPGQVFTRAALGFGHTQLERTLDSHIRNLRQKIEADPAHPQYIQTVYRIGYSLKKPFA